MKSGEILKLIQKEYPSIKSDHSTKVHLGLALKELGFECKNHSNQSYYKVGFECKNHSNQSYYKVVPVKVA